MEWPKKHIKWIKEKTIYYSIPFTWNLRTVKNELRQNPIFGEWNNAIVGGPAVYLMPEFFNNLPNVSIGYSANGVMQKINPLATKTSTGCVRRCKFCAVPETEGNIKELKDWPNLPIITDNNLLACSKKHFNRVIDKAKIHDFVDFNQGIDSRLLKKHHADRFTELKNPIIRLALDSMDYKDGWEKAYRLLRKSGLPKKAIRSYALIAFDSNPKECWERCKFIESHGIKVLPMWYHELDAMHQNTVTEDQEKLGWNNYERKMIMGFFYRHRYPKERPKYFNYEKRLDKPK